MTKATRNATDEETIKMFAEAMSIVVKVLMNNHIYTFGGEIRVQEGSGSIGDRATGVIAQLVMISWDRRFKEKLRELHIDFDLLKRFVDDINGLFVALKPGSEYKEGKLSINTEKIEEDKEIEEDERTMKVIKDIANDIEEMIQMTTDVPTNNKDNKLPILDLEVWLNKDNKQVYYNYYEKLMKNPLVISKTSAMPMCR